MDSLSAAWLLSDSAFYYIASRTIKKYPLYSYIQVIPPLLDLPYHLTKESPEWAWTEQAAAMLQITATIYATWQLYKSKRYLYILGSWVTLLAPVVIFQLLVGENYPPADAVIWEQLRHPNRQETPNFALCHSQGHALLILNYVILAKGLLECNGGDSATGSHVGSNGEKKANIKSV